MTLSFTPVYSACCYQGLKKKMKLSQMKKMLTSNANGDNSSCASKDVDKGSRRINLPTVTGAVAVSISTPTVTEEKQLTRDPPSPVQEDFIQAELVTQNDDSIMDERAEARGGDLSLALVMKRLDTLEQSEERSEIRNEMKESAKQPVQLEEGKMNETSHLAPVTAIRSTEDNEIGEASALPKADIRSNQEAVNRQKTDGRKECHPQQALGDCMNESSAKEKNSSDDVETEITTVEELFSENDDGLAITTTTSRNEQPDEAGFGAANSETVQEDDFIDFDDIVLELMSSSIGNALKRIRQSAKGFPFHSGWTEVVYYLFVLA